MSDLAIAPEDLAIVQDILAAHLPAGACVYVYGSRVGGRHHRRGSDLDLSIDAGQRLDGFVLSELQEAFTESMLPYVVDFHDRHRVDARFLAQIAPDFVALPMRGAGSAQRAA